MPKVPRNSVDPRVIRTRQMLRTALFTLLETKHFEVITVLAITEQAGLNAATFYLHYDDKWDLLNSIVAEIGMIVQAHQPLVFRLDNGQKGISPTIDLRLFEHIEQYRDFYRLMLGKNGIPAVRYALERQFQQVVRSVIAQLPEVLDGHDIPAQLIEHYYAGAYLGAIQWWLAQNEAIPPEQITRWVADIQLESPP
ncbi:MAG: TetR/AcrR family transcriptional regulator C-terminal domain-containing protein [Anaerolineae bacterium]|jgi:AcrR family transcriptional regulator|nr:TetR/AcrR family transcriptional regulator C-terminal domain-containing protein [Anaerolineae bacterium]